MTKLTYTVAYTRADEFEDWLIDNGYEYKRNEDCIYDVFTVLVLEDEEEEVDELVENFFNHE